MSEHKQIKKFAYKAGILTLIGSSIIINEQILCHRLNKQKKEFSQQKEILQNRIKELELQKNNSNTSFVFYKHLRNNVDYKDFEAIDTLTFQNKKENPFEQYRPQELTKELVENNDSSISSPLPYNKQLDEQEKFFKAMNESDSIIHTLQNGQQLLQSLLNTMIQHNHYMGGSLSRIIDNTEEENDREFKARSLMFKVKTKNKIYQNQHELNRDFYRIIFLKNTSVYKRTANMLTQIVDSLTNKYKEEIKQDSLAFEENKNRQIDSLLNSTPKTNYTIPFSSPMNWYRQ